MKRKPTAPLTKEDFAILTGKWEGRSLERPRLYPIGHSAKADRADAALMLDLVKPRGSRWCYGCPAGPFACPTRCQRQIHSDGSLWVGAEVRVV